MRDRCSALNIKLAAVDIGLDRNAIGTTLSRANIAASPPITAKLRQWLKTHPVPAPAVVVAPMFRGAADGDARGNGAAATS